MRRPLFILIGSPLILLSGCGGSESTTATTTVANAKFREAPVSVVDKTGDPDDFDDKRYPLRGDLDIRRVQLRRLPIGLEIVIETVKPIRTGQEFEFQTVSVDGSGGQVRADVNPDGSVTVLTIPETDEGVLHVPPDSAELDGNRLTLVIPRQYINPPSEFRWNLWTSRPIGGGSNEIEDWVPDIGEDPSAEAILKRMAHYP